MADLGQELAALNFGAMIGGPLIAVVNAQARAAMTTVDFVKSVGFSEGNAVNVTFKYSKTVDDPTGQTRDLDCTLSVPILTLLPIPFLRIEETTIDFNAKIVGTETSGRESTFGINTDLGAKWGGGALSVLGGPQIDFKTSIAYQSKSSQGTKVERTYSMNIKVRAVQDQVPPGMDRLLSILENSIREHVAPAAPIATTNGASQQSLGAGGGTQATASQPTRPAQPTAANNP